MTKTIKQLEEDLFNEINGSKFSKILNKLLKIYSEAERENVLKILMQYSKYGKILNWRNFLLPSIIELIHEGETKYVDFFEWTITQPELAYRGISGLLKTKGEKAYPVLIDLAQNKEISTETRAKAIKSISVHAKQPFDRGLPVDPGYWKENDLRIPELLEWQKHGYKHGIGYVEPQVHPTLKNPKTELERAVFKLEQKLAAKRKNKQDLSNPSNWLAIADSSKINEIKQKWKLPEVYLTFLKYYSPVRVFVDNDKFFQGLRLYGADELIENQAGYSFNANTGESIDDWPLNYVVIADAGADPFCIDIGNIKDNDAAIYTSMHGAGKWEFKKYAKSFIGFLKDITTK